MRCDKSYVRKMIKLCFDAVTSDRLKINQGFIDTSLEVEQILDIYHTPVTIDHVYKVFTSVVSNIPSPNQNIPNLKITKILIC